MVIEFTIDPVSIRPNTLPPTTSKSDGSFEAPVSSTGAGLLEYELQVVAHRQGYKNLWTNVPLPSGNKRLIIVLAPGAGGPRPAGDVVNETIRIGEELQRK